MQCKGCGLHMPEPPPVHRPVEYYRVRMVFWLATVAIALILSVAGCEYKVKMSEQETFQKAIENPTIKVDITEYDAGGRPVRKFTR